MSAVTIPMASSLGVMVLNSDIMSTIKANPTRGRGAALALGLPLAVGALGYLALDRVAVGRAEETRHQAGIPADRGSLYTDFERRPDQNGVSLLLGSRTSLLLSQSAGRAPRDLSTGDRGALARSTERRARLIEDAERVLARPGLAFPPGSPLFGRSTEVLVALDRAVSWVALRAMLRSERGDLDGCLGDLRTVAAFVNRVGRIPTVTAGLRREECLARFCDTVATCASGLMKAGQDPRRLLPTLGLVQATDKRRTLMGEASKQVDAATRSPGRDLHAWQDVPGRGGAEKLAALATRFRWGPELAAAWKGALASYDRDPGDLDGLSRPLVRFESRYPAVEWLTWAAGPKDPERWLRRSKASDSRLALLRLALTALGEGEPPSVSTDPATGKAFAVRRRPTGWQVWGMGEDGRDDRGFAGKDAFMDVDLVVAWDGESLTIHGR